MRSSGNPRGYRYSPDEFERLVTEAKERCNITDIVGRITRVRRTGHEYKCLCVKHKEKTPSMQLNDNEGTFHCFGCGFAGNIIQMVMFLDDCGFMEAVRRIMNGDLPEPDLERRKEDARKEAEDRSRDIAEAAAFWDEGKMLPGTAGKRYLLTRGITIEPPTFRFGMVPAWRDKKTGEWGRRLPALLGRVTSDDATTGIQRIFLRDGGRAKANMKRPKLSLGQVKGGAIWIGEPSPEIMITEGPEDALTLAQKFPGTTVLAALGTAMMPAIAFPAIVDTIVIAGQNDGPGRAAVDAASEALLEQGYAVDTMFPPEGYKDWNDLLRGIRQ